MRNTLAVTILECEWLIESFRHIDVRHLKVIQVVSPDELIGHNVVAVENNPDHPAHAWAIQKLESRVFEPSDRNKEFVNGLGRLNATPS